MRPGQSEPTQEGTLLRVLLLWAIEGSTLLGPTEESHRGNLGLSCPGMGKGCFQSPALAPSDRGLPKTVSSFTFPDMPWLSQLLEHLR